MVFELLLMLALGLGGIAIALLVDRLRKKDGEIKILLGKIKKLEEELAS